LLQKLDDHVKKNFPRMFLDYNEYGVSGTFLIEMLKVSRSFYSEYSDWATYNDEILSAMDATVLSSASQGGKMRNSFLIKRFQVQHSMPNQDGEKKAGFFDGLGDLFGGKKNNNNGQNELSRMGG